MVLVAPRTRDCYAITMRGSPEPQNAREGIFLVRGGLSRSSTSQYRTVEGFLEGFRRRRFEASRSHPKTENETNETL